MAWAKLCRRSSRCSCTGRCSDPRGAPGPHRSPSQQDLDGGRLIAAKYAEAFDAAYDRLAAFPRIGPTRPALGPQARIWVVPPYVIACDYADDTVTVLRVLHGKRDITGDLIGRR